MYRLKPELFNDLDPLNLELDTAEFQEISEILIKEKEKSNVDKKKNVILTPKFIVCDDKFVNESIGRFTKTKEFVKLTYKFLQVAIDTKDETYISQLLHLLHAIFLDDGNLRGDRKYLSEEFVNIPICDLLLTIVDSTMSRNIINKAEYLLDFMISADNKVIESLRSCFGDAHITDYLSKKAGTTESEAEKRKRIADARKMKVMKKFAKQRENFLANNKDLSDVITKKKEEDRENENEDAEKSDIYRHCVVCGEAESKGKTFGIFASFNSQEFWKLPYDDLDHAGVAFKDWDHQELRETNNDYGKGFRLKPTKDSGNRKQFVVGKIITTCGHGAHESCDPGSRSTGYLPCPLCNVAYTFMLPSFSFPKGKGGVPVDLLNGPPKFTKYNQIIHSIGFKKPEEILKYAGGLLSLDPHYSGINDKKYTLTSRSHVAENMDSFIFKDEMERDYLQTRYGDTFNCILKFGAVIADTIRMHEILNRIDGNDAYTNFLGEFPVDVKYLLKALILARCCTIIEGEKHLEPDYVRSVNFFWDTLENDALSGIFSEVVLLYLQTDESFLTMTRFGYIKLFAVTTYALLSRAQESKDYGALYTSNDKKLPSRETLDSLRTLALNYFPNFEGFETDTFLANLYFTVEKCMLPFLRQMIILKDILTSTFVGHKEWESIDELRNLEEEISDQEHVDLSHILCKKLGLPYLEGLVVGLDVESIITTDYDFTFERSIFDIMVNAKIPKFSQTILCLDYPGVTKLIDLPDDFGASIYKPESEHHDFRICLGCGDVVKVENGYVLYHTVRCSSYFLIFFHTRLNTLEMYCKLDNFEPGPLATSLAAPYLTEHGEVRTKSAGKATLNRMRYKYLNKLWMTQGLQKVIFRALFGQRFMPMGNEGDLNVGGMGSDDEGEDEDEDEERDDFSFGEGNVDDIHFN